MKYPCLEYWLVISSLQGFGSRKITVRHFVCSEVSKSHPKKEKCQLEWISEQLVRFGIKEPSIITKTRKDGSTTHDICIHSDDDTNLEVLYARKERMIVVDWRSDFKCRELLQQDTENSTCWKKAEEFE
jgi:hypothetical protein